MSDETFYCPFIGGNPCFDMKCGRCRRFARRRAMFNNIHNQKIDDREMERLRRMLDEDGVDYFADDFHFGMDSRRTATENFAIKDDMCVSGFSCVIDRFTYGGTNGLLELWCKGMQDPTGWLSADNVMERLRDAGIVKG